MSINFDNMIGAFTDLKFSKGCQIVPDFVPDSQIPLVLGQEALESLVKFLGDLYSQMKTQKID